MKQQSARTADVVLIPLARGFPGLDVDAVEKDLSVLYTGEGIGHVDLAGTDRFDLGAFEFDATLELLLNVEIATGFAIGGDVRTHGLKQVATTCSEIKLRPSRPA